MRRHEYRVVWLWRSRRRAEERGTLADLCGKLLAVFGGDARVRSDGRNYEVMGDDDAVVARLCVEVYSAAQATLRALLEGRH